MPGLADRCAVCGNVFTFSLPRCAFCRKPFCSSCSVRVGGSSFSSKECGHAFFYGGQEDVEEEDRPEAGEEE